MTASQKSRLLWEQEGAPMTSPEAAALTIDEMATLLDPPMTRRQLADLIAALDIRPVGKRQKPGRGRPALTYDAAELMRLHAAVARWL
jgi:predicted ArsR family transcriptional regulator